MSMSTNIIYGYGVECYCSDDKLVDFIKAHKVAFCQTEHEKELYAEMLENTEDEYDLEDFYLDYSCDTSGMEGFGAVISNIMSRETGIRFSYCCSDDDCGTGDSVIFADSLPWYYNEVEKNLTQEDLSDIFKRYMNELGITTEADYIKAEYFG